MTALASPAHTWPLRRVTAHTPTRSGARHRATRLPRPLHPAQRLLTALMVGGLLAVLLVVGFTL